MIPRLGAPSSVSCGLFLLTGWGDGEAVARGDRWGQGRPQDLGTHGTPRLRTSRLRARAPSNPVQADHRRRLPPSNNSTAPRINGRLQPAARHFRDPHRPSRQHEPPQEGRTSRFDGNEDLKAIGVQRFTTPAVPYNQVRLTRISDHAARRGEVCFSFLLALRRLRPAGPAGSVAHGTQHRG